jgi:hypothetical protein
MASPNGASRTPDFIVQPNIGHTYSGSTKKPAARLRPQPPSRSVTTAATVCTEPLRQTRSSTV